MVEKEGYFKYKAVGNLGYNVTGNFSIRSFYPPNQIIYTLILNKEVWRHIDSTQ
jgi:hypothetical protein